MVREMAAKRRENVEAELKFPEECVRSRGGRKGSLPSNTKAGCVLVIRLRKVRSKKQQSVKI